MNFKKILVISYYWPPSGGVGVQRILKFVKYLPEYGILPEVVTVKEDKASYPSEDRDLFKDVPENVIVRRTDTTEPFAIYSKLLGKKSIPTGFSNESNPTAFQKFSRFVRGNLFIPDARVGWNKYAYSEAKKIIEKENIKTVLTTSPPHSTQLVGLKLKKEFGKNINWIADLRDPWTDIHYYDEFRHTSLAKKKDLNYEKTVLENADRIITVSDEFGKMFAAKSDKTDPHKIFTITNGFDESDFKMKSHPPEDEFVITVTGTMPENYNPFAFIDALKITTGEFPEVKFRLRLVGNAAETVTQYIENAGLKDSLELIPTVPHEKAVEYLFNSTALFLVIPQFKNEKGLIPAKLFEYLASRKPIICLGPEDCEAAEIISKCGAGKTFNRDMQTQLSEYIKELVLKWKSDKNIDIENKLLEKYTRSYQAGQLAAIIKEMEK